MAYELDTLRCGSVKRQYIDSLSVPPTEQTERLGICEVRQSRLMPRVIKNYWASLCISPRKRIKLRKTNETFHLSMSL